MGTRLAGIVVLVAACGGDVPDCEAGFELRDDDHCYATGGAPGGEGSLEAILDALPACELLDPDGALDLVDYCAGPGCADDTFGELQQAYGPGVCGPIGYGRVECVWNDWDIVGNYIDEDDDGEVGPDQLATGLFVGTGFPGASEDGLSASVSLACFVEAYGLPTSMEPTEENGAPWFSWWGFDYGAFYLIDRYDAVGAPGGDGMPEYLWLNGPS